MLSLSGLTSGYDGGTVLHGLDLEIPAGSVHAVVGHNGAGKTTLIHTVAGLVPATSGRVSLADSDVTRLPAHRRARAGVGLVPQGRRVFPGLTVQEHLTLAAGGRRRRAGAQWTPDSVKELLPRLAERAGHRGRQLSGGEQQMLAIARALLTQPRLLLLDEPTEGLDLASADRLVTDLLGDSRTVVLVTHRLAPLTAADEIVVLDRGKVVQRGPHGELVERAGPYRDLWEAESLQVATRPT
jgi:branched-chain amino acid transport system ATP-binding protein